MTQIPRLCIAGLLLAGNAFAQRIFLENFDREKGELGSFGTGSAYIVPVSGELKGNAVCLEMIFTDWSQDLGWNLGKTRLSGNRGASLRNYILSFDLHLTSAVAKNGSMRIRLEGWAQENFQGAKTTTEEGLVALPPTGTTQHYELNLGTLLKPKTFDPLAPCWQIIFNPKCWELGGPGAYTILIDNVALTQVDTPLGR